MKGYIYTMFAGADPGRGWTLNDPIFGKVPTLGACVPNIRRVVSPGDFIFIVSGRSPGVQQYIVGGFEVAEKINALAAYGRFPENRQVQLPDGRLLGNVIVQGDGTHSPVDYHSNFEKRLENYVVGRSPLTLDSEREVMHGRAETLPFLSNLFGKPGTKVSEVLGRWRRLESPQITETLSWIDSVKMRSR